MEKRQFTEEKYTILRILEKAFLFDDSHFFLNIYFTIYFTCMLDHELNGETIVLCEDWRREKKLVDFKEERIR